MAAFGRMGMEKLMAWLRRALLVFLVLVPLSGALARDSLVERVDSPYNSIIVRKIGSSVYLDFVVGRCEFVESIRDLDDPTKLPVSYTRSVTAALAYPNKLDSILEIGVGGGSTLSYLQHHLPKTRLTGVEIDPSVVAMAIKHFGLKPDERMKIEVADGRKYLAEHSALHDIIIVDAYRGTWVPETLTSVEFFGLVKARLSPNGVVAQNVEPTTLFYDSLAATLKEVFGNVEAYSTGAAPGAPANVVLIAYSGKARARGELAQRAAVLQKQYGFRHALPALVAGGHAAGFKADAPAFRDDRNSANTLLMIDRANSKNTPRQRREDCE